jgi:hypothetical protein
MVTIGMPYVLRAMMLSAREEVWGARAFLTWALPALAASPVLFLVASASLAHPYENRSSAFRGLAVVGVVALAAWAGWTAGARSAGLSAEAVPAVVAVCAFLTGPFWLFAVTEEARLTPRVRTLVPRRAPLALLAAPFLPGGPRGLLFVVLLAAVAVATMGVLPRLFEGVPAEPVEADVAVLAWVYVVAYASLARGLRRLAPPGPRWTALVRVGAPAVGLLLALVPTLLEVLEVRRPGSGDFLGVLDPLGTLGDAGAGRTTDARVVLYGVGLGSVLVHVPAMVAGVAEVLVASRERRRRAA